MDVIMGKAMDHAAELRLKVRERLRLSPPPDTFPVGRQFAGSLGYPATLGQLRVLGLG